MGMREHKYRAWDKKLKLFTEQDVMIDSAGDLYYWCSSESERCLEEAKHNEVQFYTGLKDQNGKEIYEGDIVSNYYFGEERAIVIFHCGCFKAEPNCYSEGSSFTIYDQLDREEQTQPLNTYIVKWKGSEVIGNIYEHAELLEAK